MKEFTLKEFIPMQPGYPEVAPTDEYYLNIANELAKNIDEHHLLSSYGEDLKREIILGVVGYFQDVISDSGIWRSFITFSKEIYGAPLPMFTLGENYIESELNIEDIQFLIWYYIECSLDNNGTLSPYNKEICEATKCCFAILDKYYDDAPNPTEYNLIMDVELNDAEQIQQIYDLSYWLFWNSYFMRPAATPTLKQNLLEGQQIIKEHPDPEEARPLLLELNQRIMADNPTGPHSLFMREWLKLIVENRIPHEKPKTGMIPHKFYKAFFKANNNKPIRFIKSYTELEDFLSNNMKWGESENGHLPQLKEYSNFVLYATPEKGLLVAPEISQYVFHPENFTYNKDVAHQEAHTLITEQGRCPIDLVKYLFSNNLVPDAHLPWDNTEQILLDNWDFLARLYLQSFYRAK